MSDFVDVTSIKLVRYTISPSAPADLFIDRISLIALAKRIEELSPRPIQIQYLYHQFNEIHRNFPPIIWTEQFSIDRLCYDGLIESTCTTSGKVLYHITRDTFLNALETQLFFWQAWYHSATTYDQFQEAVLEYRQENSVPLQTFESQYSMNGLDSFPTNTFTPTYNTFNPIAQTSNYTPYAFTVPNPPTWSMSFSSPPTSMPGPVSLPLPMVPVTGLLHLPSQTPMPVTTPDRVALRGMRVESGCTTPESQVDEESQFEERIQIEEQSLTQVQPQQNAEQVLERGPINSGIDALIASLSTPEGPTRRKRQVPISQFEVALKESKEDEKAAWKIAKLVKVLAMNPKSQTDCIWSLQSEITAIKAMSINDTLNIGSQERKMPEKLRVLLKKYDTNDENGNESFQRALLMVAVRLLRQKFVNANGTKGPGKYAADFDGMLNCSARFISNSAALCRIIVSCGHPCILIVLIRMAIRNKLCLGRLIDELPLQHFCRFIATSKVTDHHSQGDQVTIHDSLTWLHGNVLLPLLYTASKRVQKELFLIEGSLECNVDNCLTAIVHHTKQVKYGNYLVGQGGETEWDNGRVLLETRSFDKSSKAEFSIEKNRRTFNQFNLAGYSHIEQLEDPPDLLCKQILSMHSD